MKKSGPLLLILLCVFLTGTTPAQLAADRDSRWRNDLRFASSELSKRHKNLFFHLSRAEFEARVAAIDARVPRLTDREIRTELIKLVASVRDGHTQVWWKPADFSLLPIWLYRFSDGWYVINADKKYASMLGKRIIRIGRTDIDHAAASMKQMIACDNEPCYTDRLPQYLNIGDFLAAAGISDDRSSTTFEAATPDGRSETFKIAAIDAADMSKLGLVAAFPANRPVPLYRRHREKNYWSEYLADSRTLYVNYRRCVEMDGYPFATFAAETLATIDRGGVERIVIDLRQNGGGNEALMRSLSVGLRERKRFREKGRVIVLIGRATYSSAANNAYELKGNTNAIFIGEPTGQKPNHYGEVKSITLPNSGTQIGYSSNYFKRTNGDPPTIEPDVNVPLSFADYIAGRDVALEAAIAYRPK